MSAPTRPLDPTSFRSALGRFASGVTVVTYRGPDGPRGLTVNAFCSVSLDPPLILVSIARWSRSHDLVVDQPFTVNVLKPEQEALAKHFAGIVNQVQIPWYEGQASPRLYGALVQFECSPWRTYDGGDHSILVGQVIDLQVSEGDALGFFSSRFIPIARPIPSQPTLPFDPFELPYDA